MSKLPQAKLKSIGEAANKFAGRDSNERRCYIKGAAAEALEAQKLVEVGRDIIGMAEKIYGQNWRDMSDGLTSALVIFEQELIKYEGGE